MAVLKDVSILWSMIHTLILFLFLFESRYPKKKAMFITIATMVPLLVVNLVLFILVGGDRYGTLMLLTLSLPSCVIFFLLSKYRNGRFFFTFCMVDTVVLEIVYITSILNHYLTPDSNWVMFFGRLISYPIIELIVYRRLRPLYLEVQRRTRNGWGIFATIGVLFYIAITLLMTYPDNIVYRPAQIPTLVLLFVLMPVIYIHIISTLYRQQVFYRMTEQENIMKLQVANIVARVEEYRMANEAFRKERHDFRHKLKAIASLIAAGRYDELAEVIEEYVDDIEKINIVRYSDNAVIDSILSVYIRKATDSGIRVKTAFAFPAHFETNATELATAFANAIENAIQACEKIPEKERFIEIKVLTKPRFMIMVRNSFDGNIQFNDAGIPENPEEEHGFGTRSIAAFCEKAGGYYSFKAEGTVFTLYMYLT